MGARLLSFLSCLAYGKFGITAVMRLADAVRPVCARVSASSLCNCHTVPVGGRGSQKSTTARTGMDHDQQLHQSIVDVAGCCGLDDEDILVSYGLSDCNTRLLIRVVQTHGLRDLYSQPVSPQPMVRHDMTPATRILPYSGRVRASGEQEAEGETDRSATSRARMGWEFPLSSLISLDMVDMVEKKVVSSGDAPFLHRSIYVPS